MPKKKKSEAKSQQKEQIKNCKLYLNLDLSSKSAGGLLPYKFLLDSLSKTLENKDKTDEESCNKLREIFLEVNKANFDIKISNVKKKNEKPHKIDLEEAEQFFNQNNKAYEEKMYTLPGSSKEKISSIPDKSKNKYEIINGVLTEIKNNQSEADLKNTLGPGTYNLFQKWETPGLTWDKGFKKEEKNKFNEI